MSKKRVLNITSRKKKDTMLAFSNTDTSGASKTPARGPLYIPGNNYSYSVWCPTARDLTPGTTGGLATIANESYRTSTTCYMRGLAESLRIQTTSGLAWFHRRICFTSKGDAPFRRTYTGDTGASQQYIETSLGMSRLWFNNMVNNTPNYLNQVNAVLFRGSQGQDWDDLLTAVVDTRRVSVKFDKTWTLQSGNNNGVVRKRKIWHAMNKNMVYDDDESAITEETSYFSTDSRAGMGDYYVIDIIIPAAGGTSTDGMRIDSTSTLYWHEK
jgi:hypothetical protein